MNTMPPPQDSPDDDLSPLLGEPFARAWAVPVAPDGLQQRLLGRLQQSQEAERGMVTVRRRSSAPEALAEGVLAHWLYRAPAGRALRPGEPRAARRLALRPGATVTLPVAGTCEVLVLQGSAQVQGEALQACDFLLLPAGGALQVATEEGAELFLRESDTAVERTLVRDTEAGWPEFAPGIRRRVLWSGAGQAALLYQAAPGAAVPAHGHGHDEECLMVRGELFLDDVLLQQGDYQLAPAGTGHRITETDTGVILYAHGDLDLQFT